MRGRHLALTAGLSAVVLLPAAPALAGTYSVDACLDSPRGLNLSWSAAFSTPSLPAYEGGCIGSSAAGLISRNAVIPGGLPVAAFASSSWSFQAPPGASISHADISVRIYRFGGGATDQWGVGVRDETGAYLLGGIGRTALDTGARGSYFDLAVANRSSLTVGLVCANKDGCSILPTKVASAGYARARADLYGARVRINDPVSAIIGQRSGSLWTSSKWLAATQSLSFAASDNVGIASIGAQLGTITHQSASECDFARPVPCPAARDLATTFDTRQLPDGPHTLTIEALDSAGNRTSETHPVLVDNTPPRAPGAPQLSGEASTSWRAKNSFTLSYSNPVKTAGAPLSGHDVEICAIAADQKADPTKCLTETRVAVPGVDTVQLPSRGRYRMRVRVNDELFSGEWGEWSAVLRFDDQPPGTPVVSFPGGWVNRHEASVKLKLGAPQESLGAPVSGYRSYAVSVDGGAAMKVPADGAEHSGAFDLEALIDGRHSLRVTATSGAGTSTPAPLAASGELAKDVVAPALAVGGDPGQGAFVTSPVTFSMSATDQTSGMTGAVAPQPVSSGGYIATLVDQQPAILSAGPSAHSSPGDGAHTVETYAVDVAGNRSTIQAFRYQQDTKQPDGGLRPIDLGHPSLLHFVVEQSCLGHAVVELSTSPGEWLSLPTSAARESATALVPVAVWSPRTSFSTRAVVTDCAGHRSVLTQWYGGPHSGAPIGTITPPAREQTLAKMTVGPGPKRRGAPIDAVRRVTLTALSRSGEPLRDVLARVDLQPWMTPTGWAVAGSLRTDSHGQATALVGVHSSVRLRIVVPGSDTRNEAISNAVSVSRAASTVISASPRVVRSGRSVTLSGRLQGGYIPRGGLRIALYGLGPRSRGWVPIRTEVAVDSAGRWRIGYRFLKATKRGSFRFRVRIPSRPDYPFSAATSQSVAVSVRR